MGFNLKSVFFCAVCIFLIQVYASEFNAESFYEKMAEVKYITRTLEEAIHNIGETTKKMEKRITNLEETTRKIGENTERITNLEETTKRIKKQTGKIRSLRRATKRLEKKVGKIAKFEEITNKTKEQANKIASLEETANNMVKQADRITKLEETTGKIKKQADKIAILEDAAVKTEKQTERIINLEEATSKIEKQADKITKLEEETADKIEKQADRITKLEKNVKKIENMTTGGERIENAIQSLNTQMKKLENNTVKNENVISNVALMANENKLKALNESESSIKIEQNVAKKQSAVVRKMLYAFKKSFHNKFITLKNETKLQLSAMNTSVESQILSVKTFLKLTENNVSQTLNDYSKDMSETNERKLESLRKTIDKGLDQYKTTLNETNVDIQELQKTLVKVEERQGRLEDGFGDRISDPSSIISKEEERTIAFSAMLTKEKSYYGKKEKIAFDRVLYSYGGGYDKSTGIFTAPKSGTYLFTYNIESSEDGMAHVALHAKGNYATETSAGPDDSGGNVGIAYLSSGQQAWIQTVGFEDRYYIWPHRTTFNGILID